MCIQMTWYLSLLVSSSIGGIGAKIWAQFAPTQFCDAAAPPALFWAQLAQFCTANAPRPRWNWIKVIFTLSLALFDGGQKYTNRRGDKTWLQTPDHNSD